MKFITDLFNYEEVNQVGLSNELRALYVYSRFINKNESILLVCNSLYDANIFYQSISNYTKDCLLFPMDDFLTSEALAISPELKNTRLETLNDLLSGAKKIVITNLMGFLRFLPEKDVYKKNILTLKINEEIDINDLIVFLASSGYERQTVVNKTGEYAVRGYVVDIFPISSKVPIRIEFWGNQIDTIKSFNVDSQLTIDNLQNVVIYANTEFLLADSNQKIELSEDIVKKQYNLPKYTKVVNLFNYVNNGTIIYNNIDEIQANYELLKTEINNYSKEMYPNQKVKYMFSLEEVEIPNYYNFSILEHGKSNYTYNSSNVELNFKKPKEIGNQLNKMLIHNKIIVCVSSKYIMNKIIDEIDNVDFVVTNEKQIFDKKVNLIIKKINCGFRINDYICISEAELLGHKNNYNYKSNFKIGSKIRDITKLNIGDYVVHSFNGIGRYLGIKTLEKQGVRKDYLHIEYDGGDKLYVPVEKIDIISKYSNSDALVPKLSKLGTNEFSKIKLKVKAKVQEMAHELLELYAKREASKGFKFKPDDENQVLFESEFPFEETSDQLKAIKEIKQDMEKEQPMDRLLCGDVGFGKTEVAFRAIFKAIMSGKQTAILCPTTILSDQHYKNALERFKSFPVNIAMINRFVSSKKIKEIIDDLSKGKIDLLIGTHRILGKDVVFKDLGLLVIDEEQRFGVTHKEKIKKYKENIDVLTLSATPIPRTLQMSLSGIRSLSLIETPPVNRYPIQTYVLSENTQIIKDAIYKELARNGQIFILYNNIETMEAKKDELYRLVPNARITYVHGRMEKNKLEEVMLKFINKEYDILLCTTIIETGIDIPSVNTLIIYDADRYGLAQLYQIRGRVGRSDKIAYCYLMYNKGKILSDVATKRLNAIKDFTELGSGLSVAMRDLSIRGAGDILGSEQAGFVASVGIDMFMNMLNEEVERLNGKEKKEISSDAQPLLNIETFIPDSYVADEEIKIEIHKKINSINSKETLEKVSSELEDRFGKIPDSLIIYMYEEWFEKIAEQMDINKITQTKNTIEMELPEDISMMLNFSDLLTSSQKISKNIRFKVVKNNLIIAIDINNLDKHYIYYLIDILLLIQKKLK